MCEDEHRNPKIDDVHMYIPTGCLGGKTKTVQ